MDDISCSVVFFDKKLIMRNYSSEELERLPRCNIQVHVNQVPETSLEDILASGNIIQEEEDDSMLQTQ